MAKQVRFPNESAEYRTARDRLLQAEAELRAQVERVAALRRQLPPGGAIKQDYGFEELAGGARRTVKLSELFPSGKDTLFLYSFMFGAQAEAPCPLCTSFLDALDGQVQHLSQRIAVAVAAKAPIERLARFAASRNWTRLRILSAEKNSYQTDYFGEDADSNPWPMANVFVKRNDKVHHFWGSELLYAESAGDTRHIDMIWPLWNVLDLTPGGRGSDWYPKLSY
jgi:predicted dithiol-disulfide oxidoreductase (DUF899 family)